MIFGKKIVVATHNGSFHADEVFAIAALHLLIGKVKIVRTRDPAVIKKADYVVDVGGIYDADLNRFDHHQQRDAGKRQDVSYASFGLVWKHFGERLAGSKKAAEFIEQKLVLPVDAFDNGEGEWSEIKKNIFPYTINDIIDALNQVPGEKKAADGYRAFLTAVEAASHLLRREITWAKIMIKAEETVEKYYRSAADKRLIILEEDCPAEKIIGRYPEPQFILYQYPSGDWAVRAVNDNSSAFKSRTLFPEKWAGLRDSELMSVTGVEDAIFCHNKRFLAIAKSKEGALKLAELALK